MELWLNRIGIVGLALGLAVALTNPDSTVALVLIASGSVCCWTGNLWRCRYSGRNEDALMVALPSALLLIVLCFGLGPFFNAYGMAMDLLGVLLTLFGFALAGLRRSELANRPTPSPD